MKNLTWKFFIILITSSCLAIKFSQNDRENYSYIFAPGLNSTEVQLAKYLPKFISSTGEKVSCNLGIHTIGIPFSTCQFAEINLKSYNSSVFTNPINQLFYLITKKRNKKYNIGSDENNAKLKYTIKSHSINISKINIAQEPDLNCLKRVYNNHKKKYQNTNIIIYGTSRGAAAIFNFLAEENNPIEVKAAILEGIFDSINHIFRIRFSIFGNLVEQVLSKLTSYKIDSPTPILNINKVSKEIPILLITSKKDEIVPCQCTITLYKFLRNLGHNKCHILILNNSSHAGYVWDNVQDKRTYQFVVHAFYKHYNLPYIEKFASKGQIKWLNCQPEPDKLI